MNTHTNPYPPIYDGTDPAGRIRVLQNMLRTIGNHTGKKAYLTAESGTYDTATRDAVRTFQAHSGLPATGITDFPTWERIRAVYESIRTDRRRPVGIFPYFPDRESPRRGERSDTVLILQILLNTLQLYYDEFGNLPLSGIYDAETEDAVRAFQKISGLDATGELTPDAWNRLADEYNRIAVENQ